MTIPNNLFLAYLISYFPFLKSIIIFHNINDIKINKTLLMTYNLLY